MGQPPEAESQAEAAGSPETAPLAAPPPLWSAHARRLFFVAGLIFLGGVAVWVGWDWHQHRQDERFARNAQSFLASGDYRSAILSARQALQVNPGNLQATRVMAQLAGRFRSPEEVLWRAHLAQLEPRPENYFLLAATALEHKEYAAAEQALAAIPSEARQTPTYHKLAGALALAQRLSRLAEIHFRQAVQLDPGDAMAQLNLAAVQLLSPEPGVRAAGRRQLEELARQPGLELAAWQSLLSDAKREGDVPRVLDLARLLVNKAPDRFEFHLEWLEALWLGRHSDFESTLARLETEALANAGRAGLFMHWLNAHGLSSRALDFARRLPENLRDIQPLPLEMAEGLLHLKDWSGLERHLNAGMWGGLEFIRAALLARCAAEQERWERVQSEWNRALREAADDPTRQAMLGRLVEGWGWNSYAEEIWWKMARGSRNQRQALERLFRLYRQQGNTRQLLAVTRRIRELDANDPIALHNEALLKLLLRADPEECLALARAAYQRLPQEPSVTATLALALERAGHPAEALAQMETLPPTSLQQESVAGYYGLMLAANGRWREAVPWLEKGLRARELLPEERDFMASWLGRARSGSL